MGTQLNTALANAAEIDLFSVWFRIVMAIPTNRTLNWDDHFRVWSTVDVSQAQKTKERRNEAKGYFHYSVRASFPYFLNRSSGQIVSAFPDISFPCWTIFVKCTGAGVAASLNLSTGHHVEAMECEPWILQSNLTEHRASERRSRLAIWLVVWERQQAWKR